MRISIAWLLSGIPCQSRLDYRAGYVRLAALVPRIQSVDAISLNPLPPRKDCRRSGLQGTPDPAVALPFGENHNQTGTEHTTGMQHTRPLPPAQLDWLFIRDRRHSPIPSHDEQTVQERQGDDWDSLRE